MLSKRHFEILKPKCSGISLQVVWSLYGMNGLIMMYNNFFIYLYQVQGQRLGEKWSLSKIFPKYASLDILIKQNTPTTQQDLCRAEKLGATFSATSNVTASIAFPDCSPWEQSFIICVFMSQFGHAFLPGFFTLFLSLSLSLAPHEI